MSLELKETRESLRAWKQIAVNRQRKIESLRSSLYAARQSRDLWRHRALVEARRNKEHQ